jgi:hypothetical protein
MTTQEVAQRLVELVRQGQFDQAQNELYAPHAVSIEPDHMTAQTGMPNKSEGIEAIKGKGQHWNDSVEQFYGSTVSEPSVAGNYFTIAMSFDMQYKGQERRDDAEIAVYKVEDGKVVSEQFFY